MPGDRMRRVNEAVKEVLSTHIAGDLRDPRVGFVTVTSVETSPDLRSARVYVSVLGDEDERARTLAGLEASHGFLQSQVADELRHEAHARARVRLRRLDRHGHADQRAAREEEGK